jgi:formylglycine-generating enzyme required for sulfatase activity
MQAAEGAPIKLFCSYSHKDEELRNELAEHLFPLERAGLIEVWHDREMLPGDTVDAEIAEKLRSADLVLVLVSPSFIHSAYCYDTEFKNAIERHERGEARVVPVVLRPCQWQLTPLKALLAMPTDGRAVINWPNRDTAYDNVARSIAKLANEMRQKGIKAADPAAAGAKPASAGTSTPSPPHPGPLPRAGEGDFAEAAGIPRPPAGEGGTRDSGRVRGWAREAPKDGVYIGVDPRELPDFAVFKDLDAAWCPQMVIIPAGQFLMGSPPDEPERWNSEGPQHPVAISYRFAIGRYAVTVAEYGNFVEATCKSHQGGIYNWDGKEWKQFADKSWCSPGFPQTDLHPVSGVSWRDAQEYVEWLSRETRQPYRLPSEAEWEYACRAGTRTAFSCGQTITTGHANYDGRYTYAGGPKGKDRQQTVPVGSLPPNAWGLHEMHGNVWEWLEDTWHENYSGAPADGTAWTDREEPNIDRDRVVRGGCWFTYPSYCRSAVRGRFLPGIRSNNIGFRIARTLC